MQVLVVNDEHRLARRDRAVLEHAGLDVIDADTAAAALRALSIAAPELVILDLAHLDVPGLDLVARLRSVAPDVHLIVLSDAPDRRDCTAALLAGADECLSSPFSGEEVLARIDAMRRRDSRASGSSSRLQEIVAGVTSEVADAVIIITADRRIHTFNPAAEALYGWHSDEVVGRSAGTVLRWVGAESDLDRARHDLVEAGTWHGVAQQYHRDGSTFTVHASSRVLRDEHGEDAGTISVCRLLERTPETREVHDARVLEGEISEGLAAGEFVVHYQPIFQLRDLRTVGVEALVRWRRGDVLRLPDAFIGVAERSNLIVDIGAVVLDQACRQLGRWQAAGHDLRMTVNVSARQLLDAAFVDDLAAVLDATGIGRQALSLEVTETALIGDVEEANKTLERVAELGVGVTIDDFGTGWASLTYLQKLPITSLKIDRSFVSGIGEGRRDTAIIRSVLALGRELDLTVIAEGIETEEQRLQLERLGCRYGQGYLVARPMPADQITF